MIPDKIKAIFNTSRDWVEFNNKLSTLSNKDKGDCFEWLIKFYLLLHPKYRTKLQNVWLLNFDHVPSEVRNHLNLPNGSAYKKNGYTWNICDWKSQYTWKEYWTMVENRYYNWYQWRKNKIVPNYEKEYRYADKVLE